METFLKYEIQYKNSRDNILWATVSASNPVHALASLINAVDVSQVLKVSHQKETTHERYFSHRINTKFVLEDIR